MCREKMSGMRPNSSAFLRNLRLDMPLSKKMWLIFKNQWIPEVAFWPKMKHFESCCHYPGEPAGGGPLANGT